MTNVAMRIELEYMTKPKFISEDERSLSEFGKIGTVPRQGLVDTEVNEKAKKKQ
jgi:hypothetical protein